MEQEPQINCVNFALAKRCELDWGGGGERKGIKDAQIEDEHAFNRISSVCVAFASWQLQLQLQLQSYTLRPNVHWHLQVGLWLGSHHRGQDALGDGERCTGDWQLAVTGEMGPAECSMDANYYSGEQVRRKEQRGSRVPCKLGKWFKWHLKLVTSLYSSCTQMLMPFISL